ncbi:hypothetical protein [Streptomyces albipurpureus]|uniref:Uncharacterized protein n=1 Tax=Streptomyces albipurpureus TaxID=2897419 RepID=A0ABT0UHI7_9ACTN|nr:hypothetical protein [Streptomyces sp. CWNU-1]MCM2387504.1 hypothetical protein [Streptomyces sp. CWNU-1]
MHTAVDTRTVPEPRTVDGERTTHTCTEGRVRGTVHGDIDQTAQVWKAWFSENSNTLTRVTVPAATK